MKKTFWVLMVLSVILFSCGTRQDDTEKQKDPQQKTTGADSGQSGQNNTADAQNDLKTSRPVLLSENDFAQKVFDFRKDTPWKYKGEKPCMIDFYADWCMPCRQIAPFMEDLARTYAGKIIVYKVNTDDAQQLSLYFGINAIPAVMFCPLKGDYKIVVGGNSLDYYDTMIQSLLLGKK